tara:strand:- start:461 stop:622 length:162 start_codon:yes stop_codon:yes gene_type:complete
MIEENSVVDLAFKYPIFGLGAIILIIGMFTKNNILTYLGVGIAMIGTFLKLKK